MKPSPSFTVGQRVRLANGEVGEIAVIVPPVRNPLIELRRALGHVSNIHIRHGNDRYTPLRETESYIVRVKNKAGRWCYTWPPAAKLEACDG